MDAHELAEKLRNNTRTESDYLEVVKWCNENTEDMDLRDKDHHYLYEQATRYLMKVKLGRWDKDNAKFIINYLAKKSAYSMGIDENITVKILEEAEYKQTHGDNSNAICLNNGDDTFSISYSPTVVDNLLSDNHDQFLRGMQTVFHEVVHAQQNSVIQRSDINGVQIPYTKTMYIMALETIARKQSPKFYNENYSHLIKENHAEKIGLRDAMETMQKYNSKLYQAYNQDVIARRMENYDKNFYEGTMTLDGKAFDSMLEIDTLCSEYISKHPEILGKFPVLQIGYNMDGTKKDIIQLLTDRENMLASGRTLDKVNELYEAIANHRNVLTGGLAS